MPSLPISFASASMRRQVVGQRVVVEEELLHLGEGCAGVAQLVHDVADGARAVVVAADRLRPQAEGAAALAAAARVERHVGVLEVPAEIVLDLQVALVDGRDEGQLVHVLEDAAVGVADDHAFPVAVGDAVDLGPVAAVRHLLDGEVELLAGHEVERRTGLQALHRLHGDLGADQADLQVRLQVAQHLGGPDVGIEGGRRGVHHDHVVILHLGRDVGELQLVRGRVDQLRVLDQRRRLGQPGRVPEGLHFALHLVARAGAAVVAVEGRGLEEQCAHQEPALSGAVMSDASMEPSVCNAKRCPRQSIDPGQKPRRKTRKAA